VEDLSNSVSRKLLCDTELSLSLVIEHFVYSFPNIPERFAGATGFDACIKRGFGYRVEVFSFFLNMLVENI
jgi:hypothetical protein